MKGSKILFLIGILLVKVYTLSANNTEAQKVRTIINKVNTFWQQNHKPEVKAFWDNAVYHTGNMEAYFLTGNKSWYTYSLTWAEYNLWQGAKGTDKTKWKYRYGESDDYVLFGDWQACFQTYIDLYYVEPDKKKIARALEVMEYEMSTPYNYYWWWSDGLYMVMPVMTKLYKLTNNPLYLDKLYEYIIYSDSIMYDKKRDYTIVMQILSILNIKLSMGKKTFGQEEMDGF